MQCNTSLSKGEKEGRKGRRERKWGVRRERERKKESEVGRSKGSVLVHAVLRKVLAIRESSIQCHQSKEFSVSKE